MVTSSKSATLMLSVSAVKPSLCSFFSNAVHRATLSEGKFEFKDKKQVSDIFAKYPADRKRAAILPLLHLAQEQNGGFLNRGCIEAVAKLVGAPFGRVHETATFYHMFRFKKPCKHTVERCHGLSCYLNRNEAMKTAIERATNGTFKEGKSKDGEFDLIEVECLGACASAPIVIIDGVYYQNLQEKDIATIISKIKRGEDASEFSVMKASPPKPVALK